MTPQNPRVLIADDHPLIIKGLELVLEAEGMEVIGSACTGRQAVKMTLDLKPDVVLLDIRLPDMEGLQALAALKSAGSKTSVIILTAFPKPHYLARAMSLGAAGFLSKDAKLEVIPDAVRSVAAGEAIVDFELLRTTCAALSASTRLNDESADVGIPTLTQQEIRVLMLIAEGVNNAAIANALSVSNNTVKSHIQNIFNKLGVSDRTQAAIWAIRHGLVP